MFPEKSIPLTISLQGIKNLIVSAPPDVLEKVFDCDGDKVKAVGLFNGVCSVLSPILLNSCVLFIYSSGSNPIALKY